METPNTVEDGDEELLAHLSLYGWAWTRRVSELLAAEGGAAPKPPEGEKVTDLMTALKRSVARQGGKPPRPKGA